VDACEIQKARCLHGNAVFPGIVREVCHQQGIPWGHVSSGCIFTDDKAVQGAAVGFQETDVPNFSFRSDNCSFYSGSKALGEEVIGCGLHEASGRSSGYTLQEGIQCYLWRLRIPFNSNDNPRNYLSKLIRYKRLFNARNSLSHLDEFLDACWQCWERRLPFGIYNVTNPGSVTALEITEMMIEEGKRRDAKGIPNPFPTEFDFFRDEQEFMETAATARRSNCILDSSKLAAAGIQMTPIQDAVRQSLVLWKSVPQAQSPVSAELTPEMASLYRASVG
jgi:dTDP-4-dehydrorhamnose reductase